MELLVAQCVDAWPKRRTRRGLGLGDHVACGVHALGVRLSCHNRRPSELHVPVSLINQSIIQSFNHSINQSIDHSINEFINQLIN
jgi:hypothetical protein